MHNYILFCMFLNIIYIILQVLLFAQHFLNNLCMLIIGLWFNYFIHLVHFMTYDSPFFLHGKNLIIKLLSCKVGVSLTQNFFAKLSVEWLYQFTLLPASS